jgi:hypothetical protein
MADGVALPPEMAPFTFVHGRPHAAMCAADDIATEGPWVRMRYRCPRVRDLLERIADEDKTIVLDCSLFAQLVAMCVEGDCAPLHLGTGLCAMRLLETRRTRVCVLALPKDLYDRVKHVNSDAAQYLVGPDQDGRYLGLAKTPMRAALDEWRAYLRASFLTNARQQEDGALKTRQLNADAEGLLRWELVEIQRGGQSAFSPPP